MRARAMLFGAAIGCGLLTGVAGGQVPRGLQPVLDDLLPAANAHDTDRFLASYLHDSTVVFVYNGAVTTGFAGIRDLQLKAWAKSDVVYAQHGAMHTMVLTPDVVVVTDPLSSTRTLPNGEVRTADFAVTMVCQRRAEGWRIVYVHESAAR
jgi:ketosteroid isomerase-like protein